MLLTGNNLQDRYQAFMCSRDVENPLLNKLGAILRPISDVIKSFPLQSCTERTELEKDVVHQNIQCKQ